MPLDTAIARLLADSPAQEAGLTLAELRAATDASLITQQGEPASGGHDHAFTLPAADGYPIPVRVYIPAGLENGIQRPAMVFAHGGGWCLGSLDAWESPCRKLAEATGCVMFSVGYRLAPEHKFPLPLEDVYSVLCGIRQRAGELGLDPQRISVGGDSAGGNLAAAVCLLARDRGGPVIAQQLLLYPALDAELDTPSSHMYGQGFGLTREVMHFCWQSYLRDDTDAMNPYASPAAAASLTGLPPATILVCEYDPLRDEGARYAQRLEEEGVEVHFGQLDGMIHGCMHMTGITRAAEGLFAECQSALFNSEKFKAGSAARQPAMRTPSYAVYGLGNKDNSREKRGTSPVTR